MENIRDACVQGAASSGRPGSGIPWEPVHRAVGKAQLRNAQVDMDKTVAAMSGYNVLVRSWLAKALAVT
jgi:hypothetical protein